MLTLASSKSNIVSLSLFVACAVASIAAYAAGSKGKIEYENHLGSVTSLVAAVARDPKAENAAVKTAMAKVAARQKEAAELVSMGEFDAAWHILDDGYRVLTKTLAAMKSGTGSAVPVGATTSATTTGSEQGKARKLAAFDARMSTAKAILGAFKRQNQEKAAGKETSIAGIETRLRKAEALRDTDLDAARRLLEDAYTGTKLGLQSLQLASPSMKTGSAAAESAAQAGNTDVTQGKIERALKAAEMLRSALVRLSREKGIDSSAALMRIDALSGEARTRMYSDPARALKSASLANQTAKEAMEKLHQKHFK